MLKKLSALLLVAIMLVSAVACNKEKNNTNETTDGGSQTTPESYDATNILNSLPENNFGGSDYRIMLANSYNASVFVRQAPSAEADPADRLNSSLYARDSYLQEKYNVNITYEICEDDTIVAETAKRLVSTGTDAMDLLLVSLMHGTTNLVPENYLYDINTMDDIDLTNNWWNQNMPEAYSLAGKTFFATGDITTRGPTSVSLILFNKQLFDDNKVDYPYDDVFDGTWTYEKLYNIYKDKSQDLNADKTIDIRNDMVGFGAGSYSSFFGCGGRYSERQDDGSYTGVFNSDRNVNVLQSLQTWFNDDVLHHTGYDGVTAFKQNKVWFIEVAGCDLSLVRKMEGEFGALPFPKYDELQENYANFANPWITTCAAFPITVPDIEFSGFMAEAMGAISKYTSSPEQYEVLMMNKELRDDESIDVLEMCVKDATYDIAFIYDFGGVRTAIENVLVNDDNPASSLASIGDMFEIQLQELTDSLKAAD